MASLHLADVHEVLLGCESVDCLQDCFWAVAELAEFLFGEREDAFQKLLLSAVVVLQICRYVSDGI